MIRIVKKGPADRDSFVGLFLFRYRAGGIGGYGCRAAGTDRIIEITRGFLRGMNEKAVGVG